VNLSLGERCLWNKVSQLCFLAKLLSQQALNIHQWAVYDFDFIIVLLDTVTAIAVSYLNLYYGVLYIVTVHRVKCGCSFLALCSYGINEVVF